MCPFLKLIADMMLRWVDDVCDDASPYLSSFRGNILLNMHYPELVLRRALNDSCNHVLLVVRASSIYLPIALMVCEPL